MVGITFLPIFCFLPQEEPEVVSVRDKLRVSLTKRAEEPHFTPRTESLPAQDNTEAAPQHMDSLKEGQRHIRGCNYN